MNLMPLRIDWRYGLGIGACSALLLWLSYFPANFGFCAWFALVPLFYLLRAESTRMGRILGAWTAGLGFYLPALSWMRVADDSMVLSWIGLSIYCSVFFVATFLLLRRIDRRWSLPLTLTAPIVWTSVEFARGRLMGGFSWYFLGHSQHDSRTLLQVADLGGELTLTVLVAAVNGLIVDALTRPRREYQRAGYAVGILVVAGMAYGAWRASQNQFERGPVVALLQSNIPQDVRNEAYLSDFDKALQTHFKIYTDLADEAAKARPDLIVWAETSWPPGLRFPGAELAEKDASYIRQKAAAELAEVLHHGPRKDYPNLIGVNACVIHGPEKFTLYNSAVLVDRSAVPIGRYDKIHRVPFGEFVPFVEWLPWLTKFTPYQDSSYSIHAGTELTRLPITAAGGRTYHFGTLICYEDSDAVLAREYVAEPKVDFLVNISNDGWFKGTSEHEQHLVESRFRAVECRRAVVRAVNMGVSAVIDPNGQVTHLPGPTWSKSKKVEAIVVAPVPIDGRTSFYAMTGDWLPWGCWVMLGWLSFAPRRLK